MRDQGFIKLSRKFFENALWKEHRQYSRSEAWLDLIQMAGFEDSKYILNNRAIEVQRGEIVASRRFLENRWLWGSTKVTNFLDYLKKEGMVNQRQTNGQTIITLCNYDTYNTRQTSDDVENKPATNQRQTRGKPATNQNKEYKESKEGKESKEEINNLSPNGDIPQGELEFPLDENFESPVKPPGEKEKSSAKKEKESDRELVNKIVNYYHEKCPGLATVKTITDKRVSTVMARVRQHGKDKVAEMIERAGASNFLAGDNQRGWIADFDWIFKPTNFVKVYEGKYDNRNRTSKELPASGREGVVGNGNNPRRNDAENKRAERDALGEIARQVLHRSMPKEF